eukprot:XP_001705709.1 Hypothetical protein GL50803_90643 [Giardia lamblia ATCC 50803]
MLMRDENFNYLRVVAVCGVHECSPAILVSEAILLLNKQLDRTDVPLLGCVHEGRHLLLIALTNIESLVDQGPNGLHVIRVCSTYQPREQEEIELRVGCS